MGQEAQWCLAGLLVGAKGTLVQQRVEKKFYAWLLQRPAMGSSLSLLNQQHSLVSRECAAFALQM